ncbi:MAG: hypothetical protein HYT35_00900 [Candidatus Staskawiczbacteria bacterium]|nr:hypothetical protein [Candidatus Staskawiczbacteria bacterium]
MVENTVGAILIGAMIIMGFVLFFTDLVIRSKQEQQERRKDEAGSREQPNGFHKENKEWQERIYTLKHLLKGSSWQDPAGKEEFLRELYNDFTPQHLWYAVDGRKASEKELHQIYEIFWGKSKISSKSFADHIAYNSEIGTAIRISYPENFAVEITVGGKVAPLYQAEHSMFGENEKGYVSFLELYDEVL